VKRQKDFANDLLFLEPAGSRRYQGGIEENGAATA
jgi:hypothetical protein